MSQRDMQGVMGKDERKKCCYFSLCLPITPQGVIQFLFTPMSNKTKPLNSDWVLVSIFCITYM